MQEKLQEKFERDEEIYEQHLDIDAANLHRFSKKVLDKNSLVNKKLRLTSMNLDKKAETLRDHNQDRFNLRDSNYFGQVATEKREKDSATIMRATTKNKIADGLLQEKASLHEAHIEKNKMRHSDVQEG